MKRHYYITEDLDDLELVEKELQDRGIDRPHMHVLSDDDSQVHLHHLNEVEAVPRRNVVRAMQIGAMVGVLAASAVLTIAYVTGATNTAAGWVPFIFLSIVMLGFCTWEGGFLGIQAPHHDFKRFKNALKNGKHVFFVDIDQAQEQALAEVAEAHPHLRDAGTGIGRPALVISTQKRWKDFMTAMP